MSVLPHEAYIAAVTEALTTAGLEVTDGHTDDAETHGTHCYLNAVIELEPPSDAWPDGLLLIWEWHTGIEDGEPERSPVWEFAEFKADGSNAYPTQLPVYGYASPAAVVDAARKVIDRQIGAGDFYNLGLAKWDGGIIGDSWDQADTLDAACETWGKQEAA